MIYTVTMNPALDYVIDLDKFKQGEVNRATSEHILPGGKGLNVSIVLTNLGVENTALGFVAGFTGKEIEKRVQEYGCHTKFIEVKSILGTEAISRINVQIRSGLESAINAQGPVIGDFEIKELFNQLDLIQDGDILVLAGSIPLTLPSSLYRDIMEKIFKTGKNIKIVVDATKQLLLNVLEYSPFLVKPNKYELGEMFGVKIETEEDIITYARKLIEMGAKNVLISLAGDGALLLSEDGNKYRSQAPKGKVINSVGAGDSMVAGFIAGYLEKKDYEYALKMGLSAGSASAFSELLATKEEVFKLLKTI